MEAINQHNHYRLTTTRRFAPCASLKGDIKADVAVLGGGYTGLATALELAERGYKVALLEKEDIGTGCSGRNGGHVCAGWTKSQAEIDRRAASPQDAKRFYDMGLEAVEIIKARIEKYKIDCHLRWGYLHVAANPRHIHDLRAEQAELAQYGQEAEFYDKPALQDKLDSPAYYAGLGTKNSGHLNPLAYCYGLAEAALSAGVDIYENSPVTQIDYKSKNPALITANGKVTAKFLALGGNAYLREVQPSLYRRVVPVGSYIMATDPLPDELANRLIRDREAVADSNFILDYFRLDHENRMIYGGRCTYTGKHPKDLGAFIRPRMTRVFPQLKDYKPIAAWGGYIAITVDRLPHFGRLGASTYFAQGYCGHGLATSQIAARTMAEAISGQAERFDAVSKLDHPIFPGGKYRQGLLSLGMLYYRLKDMI